MCGNVIALWNIYFSGYRLLIWILIYLVNGLPFVFSYVTVLYSVTSDCNKDIMLSYMKTAFEWGAVNKWGAVNIVTYIMQIPIYTNIK